MKFVNLSAIAIGATILATNTSAQKINKEEIDNNQDLMNLSVDNKDQDQNERKLGFIAAGGRGPYGGSRWVAAGGRRSNRRPGRYGWRRALEEEEEEMNDLDKNQNQNERKLGRRHRGRRRRRRPGRWGWGWRRALDSDSDSNEDEEDDDDDSYQAEQHYYVDDDYYNDDEDDSNAAAYDNDMVDRFTQPTYKNSGIAVDYCSGVILGSMDGNNKVGCGQKAADLYCQSAKDSYGRHYLQAVDFQKQTIEGVPSSYMMEDKREDTNDPTDFFLYIDCQMKYFRRQLDEIVEDVNDFARDEETPNNRKTNLRA